MGMANMWAIDLAVAAGFAIGVAVKQLIDLRVARARQRSEAVDAAAKRRNADDHPL